MKILAIETSCDDTGISILEVRKDQSFNVLANIVSSQTEIHKKYGGVYPALAKREHQKNLAPVLQQALQQAKLLEVSNKFSKNKFSNIKKILKREPQLQKKLIPFLKKYAKPDVDLLAVTNGPGLEPCLWVGINFAKALSYFWDLPVIPVNHVEAHILINLINLINYIPTHDRGLECNGLEFPALCLVVSGGHTQLILMKDISKYEIIGETRDDAAGECFDKCAKILGLGYPGGPIISKLAQRANRNPSSIQLPRPMINSKDYDFSFSGLKTATLYQVKKDGPKSKNKKYKARMSAEIQQAIIDVLIKKTIKAAKDFKAKKIILGGGVSANQELRRQFQKTLKLNNSNRSEVLSLIAPPVDLSTDNGLMTAVAGYLRARQNKFTKWQDLEAKANLRVF